MNQFEFAISYAGEDARHAETLAASLGELGFDVFMANAYRTKLAGFDAEVFFEELFSKAKQVVVFISEHYKAKRWTRFEWDIILDRDEGNRFIPVRLDDARLAGLSSTVIFHDLRVDSMDHLVQTCVDRLLTYQQAIGERSLTLYESILHSIQTDSRGATAKAFQLVRDKRRRSPLADVEVPALPRSSSFRILEQEWKNFSQVRRLSLKIEVPDGLSRADLIETAKHCVARAFNRFKADALSVLAYREATVAHDGINRVYDAVSADFAPHGDWGKAMDGFAYNLPSSEFQYSVTVSESYPFR